MIKPFCCGVGYDALIDLGSSHNFISQQCFEQLKSLFHGSKHVEIEYARENSMRVILAYGSQISSMHSTHIKVKVDEGPYIQVRHNIDKSLATHIVFGMPFLRSTNPKIDRLSHVVKFGDGKCTQAVPVVPGDKNHPYVKFRPKPQWGWPGKRVAQIDA